MNLGSNLFQARKKCGLSQEEVAEKLGVSRQTISKWETNETLPDIRQSKRLALLYRLSLDELIDFDMDIQEVEQAIERTSAALEEKIDWTKAWGKKYPILLTYRQVLRDGGEIHFKTDNRDLFEWSLFQFPKAGFSLSEVTRDLHGRGIQGVMTDYEEKFHLLGTPINRCVGTRQAMDPEPEFRPIAGPVCRPEAGRPPQTPSADQ